MKPSRVFVSAGCLALTALTLTPSAGAASYRYGYCTTHGYESTQTVTFFTDSTYDTLLYNGGFIKTGVAGRKNNNFHALLSVDGHVVKKTDSPDNIVTHGGWNQELSNMRVRRSSTVVATMEAVFDVPNADDPTCSSGVAF